MSRDERKSKQVEELKGDLRSKEKLIKQLKKQLGRVAKQALKDSLTKEASDTEELLAQSFEPEEVLSEYCSKCNAAIKPILLGNRKLYNCKKCGQKSSHRI